MDAQEQLSWEARFAKPAAVCAFVSAALVIFANVFRALVPLGERPDTDRSLLVEVEKNADAFLLAGVVQSVGLLLLAGVLVYLYRATKARKPEFPSIAFGLALLGPVLLAVSGVLLSLDEIGHAQDFVDSGPQTEKRAEDLRDERPAIGIGIGIGGTLALAIAFVLISINAMRVGLLSRFMGIIGAIIGGLYVLPVLSGPLIVQLFWLLALGVLFLGYWPGGRGPAWETGEAVPWPSAAETRAQTAMDEVEPPQEGDAEAESEAPARAKRKRKKRR